MTGRKKEIETLLRLYNSKESQFVAIYGRRRIGKTYLVNEVFQNKITFKHSGISPLEMSESNIKSPLKFQLRNFYNSMILSGLTVKHLPKDWMDAFLMLELALQEKDDGSRQLVFIDELPWLDTVKSGFITAFEAFWNNWACARKNIMLVVCGSATSWMSDKLINNHGGLYNRLTYEMKLEPFTLSECEQYFLEHNIKFSRYDIASSYMICGGVPYYLSYFYSGHSLAQNIDDIFFKRNAPLSNEFNRLFNSIFSNADFIKSLVKIIGSKRIGISRDEIIKKLNISSNGSLSEALNALISSDFISKYTSFTEKSNKELYKLTDPFCNFYLKFIEGKDRLDEDFFTSNLSNQNIISWRGIAFENLCFNHIKQIKRALEITGVSTNESPYSIIGESKDGTQIDMLIVRKDDIINMCEIKFYNSELLMNKTLDRQIRYRVALLEKKISKKYAIRPTLITTFGLIQNEYSSLFSNIITLDDLFA